MNIIFSRIWNAQKKCWVACSEKAKACRKTGSVSRSQLYLLTAISVISAPAAFALPSGGTIVSGTGTIEKIDNGKHVVVDQSTNKMIVNWDSFGVKVDEKVSFKQPNSSAIALNRIIGNDGSVILGQVNSNGKVFIINPNGVVFGAGSKVNVGSLTVSTQNISNDDFNSGNYRFSGTSKESIVNEGSINSSNGEVVLLANKVINNGTISTPNGSIVLAAGSSFTVNPDGAGLVNVKIDAGAVDALVQNNKVLSANGGQVYLAARDSSSLMKTVINNTGIIEAKTLNLREGKIVLDAGAKDKIDLSGELTASAQGQNKGNGGSIDISGKNVRVDSNALVNTTASNGTTGLFSIKADDLEVNYYNNYMSDNAISVEALSNALNNSNVSLTSTNGDLRFDAAVLWSSPNKLELNAKNDVVITSYIEGTGKNASLAFNTGSGSYYLHDQSSITLSGKGASFSLNGNAYNVIQTLDQLQRANTNLNGLYVLGNDIDGANRKFQSIASGTDPEKTFNGIFDGFGHTISRVKIQANGPNAGLFASNNGEIRNINLASSTVTPGAAQYDATIGGIIGYNSGKLINSSNSSNLVLMSPKVKSNVLTNSMGGLVGTNTGVIDRSHNTGNITSHDNSHAIGGVAGTNNGGIISNSSNIAIVTGSMVDGLYMNSGAGGLVGVNNNGTIDNSHSDGNVSVYKSLQTGGLVGQSIDGRISNSSSSGRVNAANDDYRLSNVGGLVGSMTYGTVENSSTDVMVLGTTLSTAGGLVGSNELGTISNAYATGFILNPSGINTGGLVGSNWGTIKNSEAATIINASSNTSAGGLVGYNQAGATIQDSTVSRAGPNFGNSAVTAKENSNIGGAVGTNSGTLTRVTADTNVSGRSSSNTGGLVGKNQGVINDSLSKSTVASGVNSKIGGLVGMNNGDGIIFNSKFTGIVKNPSYSSQATQGLVGLNLGTVDSGAISGATNP